MAVQVNPQVEVVEQLPLVLTEQPPLVVLGVLERLIQSQDHQLIMLVVAVVAAGKKPEQQGRAVLVELAAAVRAVLVLLNQAQPLVETEPMVVAVAAAVRGVALARIKTLVEVTAVPAWLSLRSPTQKQPHSLAV